MNQTLNESIEGNAKHRNYSFWELLLIDRKLPSSVTNAIRKFSFWIEAYTYANVNVSCNFTTSSLINQDLSGELSSHAYLERILRSTAASLGELCNTEVEGNGQQTCIKISRVIRDSADSKWTIIKSLSCFVFVTLFAYIGRTVICLFVATEDTHEVFRQITVEGPSPVGLRSLIGNYFFSSDSTMWHIARKFILHVLIMPLPFLDSSCFHRVPSVQECIVCADRYERENASVSTLKDGVLCLLLYSSLLLLFLHNRKEQFYEVLCA